MTREQLRGSGEFLDIIFHGREERNIEYKASLNWADTNTKTKVARSCLAMANIADGGRIVLGVTEGPKGTFRPTGMSPQDASSFNQDDVQALVNSFADPAIDLWVHRVNHNGKAFVVVRVSQFDQVPIICKKDGKQGLNKGTVYTRSRRMPESAPVRDQTEMREILEMAVDKQMRNYVARTVSWGLLRAEGPSEDPDAAAFHSERKDLEEDG